MADARGDVARTFASFPKLGRRLGEISMNGFPCGAFLATLTFLTFLTSYHRR